MPTLPNPKHEAFVQGLLKGLSADAAYQAAGYKPHRGNASRMRTDESIVRRLEELQKTVTEKVVKAVQIDRAWVLERLMLNAQICMGEKKIRVTKVKEGQTTEVEMTARDANAANAALKLLGQIPEVALFADEDGKSDVNVTINNAPQPTGPDHLAEVANRFKLHCIDGGKKAG